MSIVAEDRDIEIYSSCGNHAVWACPGLRRGIFGALIEQSRW